MECLETLLPTPYDPVCVDLTELKQLGVPIQNTSCLKCCSAGSKRKRSLPNDENSLESYLARVKTSRQCQVSQTSSLLQDINDLMRQVQEEKNLLAESSAQIQSPFEYEAELEL